MLFLTVIFSWDAIYSFLSEMLKHYTQSFDHGSYLANFKTSFVGKYLFPEEMSPPFKHSCLTGCGFSSVV